MTSESRRDFLKAAGALAGATTAMSVFPPVIREALAIPANNATRSIRDVEHVVILMQENRSFDHYFGTFPGVRGFGDRFTIPLPGGRSVFQQSNGTRVVMPYHLDQRRGNAQRVTGTPHTWSDAHQAWADGRLFEWPRYKQNQSMGYYTGTELDFQFALANAFTLCDAYHCSLHGGTNPNRLFHWTGTNGPTGAGVAAVLNEWTDLGPSSQGYTWTTYPERLQAAGVTWKVYQNLPDNFGDDPLAGFKQYRRANEAIGNLPNGFPFLPWRPAQDQAQPLYKGVANTAPTSALSLLSNRLNEFRADIQAGKLPQVSWLVAPAAYSEHPSPSSPVQGGWYVQEALAALVANPEVWSKTVLIVNFDENDGFFDHMPAPAAASRNPDGTVAGGSTLSDAALAPEYFTHPKPPGSTAQPQPDGRVYGPGPRVPCYAVSPWSRGGWVNSEVFDHTSVLRFLERRFGVQEPNIGAHRRAVCGDLTSAFDFVTPNLDRPPELPNRSKVAADLISLTQGLLPQVAVPGVSAQQPPQQSPGLRLSRALPYELTADGQADGAGNRFQLQFINTGAAGAVFHVYDRLHLDRVPRRYTVETGKQLAGEWATGPDFGQYDLWVLGPNGFHRHFTGSVAALGAGKAAPEVTAAYDKTAGKLALQMSNRGSRACTFVVTANAYQAVGGSPRHPIAAGGQATLRLPLLAQGRWYDITVRVEGDALFSRRFAGRMEDGTPSVSDPAFGQASAT
ncbi:MULTISPECIES: phosphocholine-specific phospholipase C [Inquilinus]|uniref:phospholipase C n=1 Tax=Inquilinus ginsengisoli TaxID=363840 RepID=A0ABU1JH55_9PROT|nr:phospholipase C, phosphocholine-specific [Inquilinus ginsengisoli]MDR6287652.1 phospholipase C [Inquilinus ginsengisoli]